MASSMTITVGPTTETLNLTASDSVVGDVIKDFLRQHESVIIAQGIVGEGGIDYDDNTVVGQALLGWLRWTAIRGARAYRLEEATRNPTIVEPEL